MSQHPTSYASEKFRAAVHHMATSPDLLRIRVLSAWLGHVGGTGLHALTEDDLPLEAQKQFEALRTRLDDWSAADRDDDVWRALADAEAKRLAELICEIYETVISALTAAPLSSLEPRPE